ncbi:MAG: class I SAM-dependent methyltransferase [Candidatus Limnocylindria bacterium]|nr:class I SAM-dependent methyltransferase [Candidatus Limnocylindria bacterium]
MWEKLSVIRATPVAGRVLDVGAADGQYVEPWRDRGVEVVAVDIDDTRIAQLRERYRGADGVRIVQASVERLPFADRAFDVVWASEILEHLPTLGALGELERVSDRLVVATMPSPLGPYRYLDRTHVLSYTVGSLQTALAARAGWRYRLEGLGGCLPAWAHVGPIRRAWLRVSRARPRLAWTLLIVGERGR